MTRHLAIGDIHGCFDALRTLASFVDVGDDDVVVVLGDYVDRGPSTRDVIDWLIAFDKTNSLVALRGNHEVMMLNARINQSDKFRWGQFGAIATLDSYATSDDDIPDLTDIPESHWQFLSGLLPYYETETHIFVHATVDPRLPLNQQSDRTLYWDRYSDKFPGHSSGKVMVCGHKSQDSGLPATNGHAICIDTGACKGRWLTCLDVNSGTIWQASQDGETRQMCLGDLPLDIGT
jgi:serine/threonine protein phosphatase 1